MDGGVKKDASTLTKRIGIVAAQSTDDGVKKDVKMNWMCCRGVDPGILRLCDFAA